MEVYLMKMFPKNCYEMAFVFFLHDFGFFFLVHWLFLEKLINRAQLINWLISWQIGTQSVLFKFSFWFEEIAVNTEINTQERLLIAQVHLKRALYSSCLYSILGIVTT